MSIITIVPLFILGILGNIVLKGVPLKKTVLIWLWALALLTLGMFTGYIFGEIRGIYQEEFMERLTVEVHQAFDEGREDEIAHAFKQAKDAHENGKSSYAALSGALRELN